MEVCPCNIYAVSGPGILLDTVRSEAFDEHHDTGESFVCGLRELLPSGGKTDAMRGLFLCDRLGDCDGDCDMYG